MSTWNPRANEVFLAALEIDAAERPRFLRDQCRGDEDLLGQVESLLEASARASSFLESSPVGTAVLCDDRAGHSAAGDVAPGARLRYFGDYIIEEEIARGGMGIVYRARQVSLNRPVALKILAAGQLASPQDVRRFRFEAEAAANLDHPGIVPIFDAGELAGQYYISMGLVEGESLAKRLDTGPLPAEEAAQLMRSVAESMAYAHARGVIHRDLKPSNILIDGQSQQPRVADFGLAKRIDADAQLTATGQVLGTPSYMPPEQAAGDAERVGPAADVYSLGAVLYAALTGRAPFQAATLPATLSQVIGDDPVSPRQLNREVPRDLETICLKCLEKPIHRRYQSVQDLADELQRFLAGHAILARPTSPAVRGWRWVQRNRLVSGLAATVLLLIVLSSVVSSTLAFRASYQASESQRQKELATQAQQVALAERNVAVWHKERADRQLARAERLGYAGQISTARRHWETRKVSSALMQLDGCRWDFRGWEHDFLYSLCTDSVPLQLRLADISSVAFAPSGQRLAVVGSNGIVILDASTREQQHRWRGHSASVWTVVCSPVGTMAATASNDRTVRIWDTTDGREALVLEFARAIQCLAFSPNGERLACGGEELSLWDVTNGGRLWQVRFRNASGNPTHCQQVAFRPNGLELAVGIAQSSSESPPGASAQRQQRSRACGICERLKLGPRLGVRSWGETRGHQQVPTQWSRRLGLRQWRGIVRAAGPRQLDAYNVGAGADLRRDN